ncbi:NVEALA domain-containing protein [Capnocytophaga canis]|uniref:NVEALA domain-containing protein n=1 Tax=Capnocytophaga canis TaxID=1848903 RepID=UPI001561B7A4|nr:NVEALA domain-containing protein [Capnocytophaga canis]
MKRKVLKGIIATAVVALVTGYGISRSVNNSSTELSDLTLANLEALAQGEYKMYDDDDRNVWSDFFHDVFDLDYNVESHPCPGQESSTTSYTHNYGANISGTGIGANFGGTLSYTQTKNNSGFERKCVGGNYESCIEIDCMGNRTEKK